MSPIKTDDAPGQPMDLGAEIQHRAMQGGITEFKSIKPEDGVLQQMAEAQM